MRGIAGEVLVTGGPGDGFRLASETVRGGASLVIVWGGDGTVNEVGSALAFRDATLGIVPVGSGNGLARALGIDSRPDRALAVALDGAERLIDAGELGGHLFFNVAGLGFDAAVAQVFSTSTRRGPLAYGHAILHGLSAYQPETYTFDLDGRVFQERALLVAAANSPQYGMGAEIAPRARVDDGVLDVVVVRARPAWRAIWEIRRLFDGTVERLPGVATHAVREAQVTSDRPIRYHVDGEVVEAGCALVLRVVPGAARVKVPHLPRLVGDPAVARGTLGKRGPAFACERIKLRVIVQLDSCQPGLAPGAARRAW